MKCRFCGANVKKGWTYCPKCGAEIEDFFSKTMSNFMKDITALQKAMEKPLEKRFELFDISPFFRFPKEGRGFSIHIKTETGKEPKISVKSWGWPKAEVEKEVESQLTKLGLKKEEEKAMPVPKMTEEPKTEVRRLDSKVVVDMELPGVKSENDISIKELEQSVEVKAMAGDKAYFKIITKPAQFRLAGKKFSKGKLYLEFR
jgi:HSP20 family molecular chaperone IbpA